VLLEPSDWIVLAAIVVVILLGLGIAGWAGMRGGSAGGAHRGRRWGRRPHRNDFRPEGTVSETPTRRAAIIINPTKFVDLAAAKRQIAAETQLLGWSEPLFIETTVEDTGHGQTRQALEH
jgi:diacylglycerol kinase (ATP)